MRDPVLVFFHHGDRVEAITGSTNEGGNITTSIPAHHSHASRVDKVRGDQCIHGGRVTSYWYFSRNKSVPRCSKLASTCPAQANSETENQVGSSTLGIWNGSSRINPLKKRWLSSARAKAGRSAPRTLGNNSWQTKRPFVHGSS